MKLFHLFIFSSLLTYSTYAQKMFSKEEVKEDLQYLSQSLEEAHYNLYAYTTQKAFEENYEKIRSSIISDSLSMLDITSLFQSVISKANNGHTEIPFPASDYIEYASSGGTLFPLEIAFENGKALIRKNWSDNDSLELGSELVSINHQSLVDVLKKIYPLISAERKYFKLAKIELISFPRLYWQAFGEYHSFEVEIKKNGVVEKHLIKSIGVIENYEMKRDEIFAKERKIQFLKNIAYLRPGSFGGDEDEYRRFIDSAFIEIKKKSLPNLIIDLRDNLGGDDAYSDYLVSYIADRPFHWNADFTLKTSGILKNHVRENYDTTAVFWQNVLTHEDGSIYPFEFDEYQPQSLDKRYTGEIYVLINRQSHSQSAVTAAQIQDYEFATIVGEETGDFPSLYASQYSYALPHTGIMVNISKGYIVRVNGSKKGEGVIPDIYIKDHLLDEEDEVLNGLIEHIKYKR